MIFLLFAGPWFLFNNPWLEVQHIYEIKDMRCVKKACPLNCEEIYSKYFRQQKVASYNFIFHLQNDPGHDLYVVMPFPCTSYGIALFSRYYSQEVFPKFKFEVVELVKTWNIFSRYINIDSSCRVLQGLSTKTHLWNTLL